MPTWVQLGAQDGSKTSPRPKKRGTKTMKNRGLCWEPPRRRGTPSDRAPKADGVPLLGSGFGQFVEWILVRFGPQFHRYFDCPSNLRASAVAGSIFLLKV